MKNQAKKLLIPNTLTPTTLDILAEKFTSAMNSAAESAIPRLRPCERSKPWWTEDLKLLRKSLHLVLQVYKQTRTDTDHRIWKSTRNKYFYAIREAKTKHWEEFLSNASGKEVFRAAKYTRPSTCMKIPTLQSNEVEHHTFEEKYEAFLSTLFFPPPRDLPCTQNIVETPIL